MSLFFPPHTGDAASSSPADPLCASRGRQLANKLLQRQRRCSRLVNEACGDRLECLLSSLSSSFLFKPIQTFSVCPPPRFYLYKLPKDSGTTSQKGDLYLLLEKGSGDWTDGKGTVNDTAGALGRTVGQLYSQGKVCLLSLNWLRYSKKKTNKKRFLWAFFPDGGGSVRVESQSDYEPVTGVNIRCWHRL